MAYYTNRHFIVGPGRIRFGVGPFGQEQKRISTDRIFCVGVFVFAVVTGHKLPHHYTGLSIFVIAKLQSIDRMVYTVSSPGWISARVVVGMIPIFVQENRTTCPTLQVRSEKIPVGERP